LMCDRKSVGFGILDRPRSIFSNMADSLIANRTSLLGWR
jgi:hypothetical protein